jgi:signal transduction histidine kinase
MTSKPGFAGRRSFGLAGMRERISMLGGAVKVSSTKAVGTKIEVIVPVPQQCDEPPAVTITRATNALSAVAGESRQDLV